MPSDSTKFELQAKDYSQYLLSNPREIAQVLNNLREKRCLITAHPDRGGASFVTALLEVDAENGRIVIDAAPDEAINARAVAAEELVCATQLDRVKVQFAVRALGRVADAGGVALHATIPEVVLRLQRREYYRLTAPVSHALSCTIPLPQPDGTIQSFEARVIDISAGGIAIAVPPEHNAFSQGAKFKDCRLNLPEVGTVTATIAVRNHFRVTNRSGVVTVRTGCQFIDLARNATALIQRYIFKVERERSALTRGQ